MHMRVNGTMNLLLYGQKMDKHKVGGPPGPLKTTAKQPGKDKAGERKQYRSMWRAAREKRNAKYRHVSNDKTGFIEVDEYHLNRTGIRGRKQCLCWTALALLITVAVVNLAANILLIVVLQLNHNGLPYLAFSSRGHALFPKPVGIATANITTGIRSYAGDSINLQSRMLDVHSGNRRLDQSNNRVLNSSQLHLDQSTIDLRPYSHFQLVDSTSGRDIMTLNRSVTWLGTHLSTGSLDCDKLVTNRIDAQLVSVNCSSSTCSIKASEDFKAYAQDITIATHSNNIRVALREGDFVIGGEGTSSVVLPHLSEGVAGTVGEGGRLCICENGRVFRSLGNSCLVLTNANTNPCRRT